MEPLDTLVDELVSHIGRLSPEDEAVQNDTLEVARKIEAGAKRRKADTLTRVTRAFNTYVKKLAAGEITGTAPLEEAVILIKALVRHLNNEKEFLYDISDVMEDLGAFQKEGSLSAESGASDSSEGIDLEYLPDEYSRLEGRIDELSEDIGMLTPEDTPELGKILERVDDIIRLSSVVDASTLSHVAKAYKSYVEKLAEEDTRPWNTAEDKSRGTRPLEDGLVLMKALLRHLVRGEDFFFDISDVMQTLKTPSKEAYAPPEAETEVRFSQADDTEKTAEKEEEPESFETNVLEPAGDLSEDDIEIITDFVAEAEDNLQSIEVEIVELEQDPSDSEIINNIFRPFHTIKGVSGFLGFKKINTLAHATENLLDGARNGEFTVNYQVIDSVLKSVDLLKQLVERVKGGVEQGKGPEDGDIEIESHTRHLKELPEKMFGGEAEKLGELLVRKGYIDEQTLEEALRSQEEDHPDKKIGEILVEGESTGPEQVSSALEDQKKSRQGSPSQVKVSTEKLDDLVDYTGELVIAQAMLKQLAGGDPAFSKNITQLGQIISSIQNIAMSMRMIPIKSTFMKMIRLVRDLSKKSGKDVELHMDGENTEIDRNVVDAIYEPMVHMIRNSIDHGIEGTKERREAGKPDRGNIYLSAYHKGGNIVIEIRDDGKGLNKKRIREKAIAAGLISEEDTLTDSQTDNLIMQPGFSTADKVTDVSGRGVGMDVVKEGVEKFRGSLDIDSKEGEGTRFTIRLPLTLAIIDGMLVRIGNEKFIIPIAAIDRSFQPLKKDCYTVESKGEMVKGRNGLIPLVRLERLCDIDAASPDPWESLVVVVESKEEKRGIVVDELLGKEEFVIKSLGANLENIPGFSGGAILGDGKVGLILDIQSIFDLATA